MIKCLLDTNATKCLQHADPCRGYGVSVACSSPCTKFTAYSPLTSGSSPAHSILRPQRLLGIVPGVRVRVLRAVRVRDETYGSRTILITGAQ